MTLLFAMFAVPGGVYMLDSVFFLNAEVFDNIIKWSENSLLVCRLIEFHNNYLRGYKKQLSPFVFYLNRCMPVSLCESFISCEIHAFKEDDKPPNVLKERKMPNIHGWICAVVSRFRFYIPHQLSNKTRSFTTNLSILQRCLHFKYRTKPRE